MRKRTNNAEVTSKPDTYSVYGKAAPGLQLSNYSDDMAVI